MNIEEALDETSICKFELKFKDTCSTFYAGNIICGTVELKVRENIELRGIRAQFRGESYVHWQNRNPDGSCVILRDHQTIWNQLFTIWGKKGKIHTIKLCGWFGETIYIYIYIYVYILENIGIHVLKTKL